MDSPPSWLVRVIAGFLVLNLAGFAAVGLVAAGSACFDSGTATFSSGACISFYLEPAIWTAVLGGLLGVGLVVSGLLRRRSPSQTLPVGA